MQQYGLIAIKALASFVALSHLQHRMIGMRADGDRLNYMFEESYKIAYYPVPCTGNPLGANL
jgi:hypothetical protein